jgi:hypothetical protein
VPGANRTARGPGSGASAPGANGAPCLRGAID